MRIRMGEREEIEKRDKKLEMKKGRKENGDYEIHRQRKRKRSKRYKMRREAIRK